MCFQADSFGQLTGGQKSADVAKPALPSGRRSARSIRTAAAQPSAASVVAFLKANGIDYIYADAMHPNTLVPDADPDRDERRHPGAPAPLTIGSRPVADTPTV